MESEERKQRARERMKAYREANPERAAARVKAWCDKNPDRVRDLHLRKNYGITIMQYEAMFIDQRHRCCGCGSLGDWYKLGVDHDHATGRVRGLLCSHCNTALGLVRDNPQTLRSLADYLEAGRGS